MHRAASQSARIVPSSWFLQDEGGLASRLAQGVHVDNAKTSTHAFTILAKILKDPRLKLENPREQDGFYENILNKSGDVIREYVDQWALSGDLQQKLEELLWTNVLIYGVGGSEKSGDFNADFFL